MKSFLRTLFSFIRLLILIAVLFILLATLGEYFLSRQNTLPLQPRRSAPAPVTKPVQKPPIPWERVNADVRATLIQSRAAADSFAADQLDMWLDRLMLRVDHDFLPWYFDYWNQQAIGLKGLYQTILNTIDSTYPSAAEKLTEEIQYQFAQRVLHPELAQLELERITRETVDVYVDHLRPELALIPARYTIPEEDWQRYLDGIAVMAAGAEGNRTVGLTMKTLTASSAAGAVLLARPLKAAVGKIGMKYSAKLAAKSAAKIAAKTGKRVASKRSSKLLGPIIGLGIIIWDALDHEQTRAENEPVLRENIHAYLREVRDHLLHDTESGVMSSIHEIENTILASLDATPSATADSLKFK